MATGLSRYLPRPHTRADAEHGGEPRRRVPAMASRALAAISVIGISACNGASSGGPAPSAVSGGGDSLLSLSVTCVESALIVGQRAPCIAAAHYRSGRQPLVSLQSTWLSSAPHVVAVDATGLSHGKSAGQAVLSATYQGQQASAVIGVSEEDALRVSAGAYGGDFTAGSTVTMWLQGYYSVASESVGRLSLRITDQDGTITASPPLPVEKGGDSFVLSSTFVVPAGSVELCRQAVLEVGVVTIVAPTSKEYPWCVPVRR